jgi:hypothetical protein
MYAAVLTLYSLKLGLTELGGPPQATWVERRQAVGQKHGYRN